MCMMVSSARALSVVIRTYSEARWDSLVAAVTSVRRQSAPPAELVIVVDHNPALLARVRGRFPAAVVVENREPPGSSGAWNSGVAATRGDVVAFLDDDAVAAPDWLAQLAAEYDDATVAGVGGGIDPRWLAGRPAWFPQEFDWVVGCTYRGLPETKAEVRNLIGCNMSFRRQVLEAVGGFREGIGHIGGRPLGCDETELSIRVRQRWPEQRLLHNPSARVAHQVPASRGRWRYFATRCAMEGRSKALVSRFVGVRDGLAAERTYTFRTLPRGVARGVGDAVLRRDLSGLARAAAIVAGLAITTAGYLAGVLRSRPAPAPPRRGAGSRQAGSA